LKRPSSSVKQLNRALLDRTAFVGDVVIGDTYSGKVMVNSVNPPQDSWLKNAKPIIWYKVYCPCGLNEPVYTWLGNDEFFRIGDYPICDCGNYLKVKAEVNE
jgi:hypothetical protein